MNETDVALTPLTQASLDYQRIERAIRYLQSHFLEQPDLATVARAAHLSEYHFQRLFSRWAGISPKRFLQFLTLEHAKRQLAESKAVLTAALDSGLSGSGRLHDLFVAVEAVTPGEFKSRGAGIRIEYGFHPTRFGPCLLGLTARGICWLSFVSDTGKRAALRDLKSHWTGATFAERPEATGPVAGRIFPTLRHPEPWTLGEPADDPSPALKGTLSPSDGERDGVRGSASLARPIPIHLGGSGSVSLEARPKSSLSLLLMGTNFQIKVWRALLEIPAGAVVPYEAIGARIGASRAARAIGAAVGQNAVAYLIPCHRVIRKSGVTGGYRWGSERKQAMLAWEAARTEPTSSPRRSTWRLRPS